MRTVACDILSFNESIEEYNMKFAKVIAFVSLACLMASAQEKTAFVNMEKIFEEYYKTVNANIIFEQQKQNFDEHLELIRDEVDAVAKEVQKYEAEARNDLAGEATREEAKRKFQVRLEHFRNKRQELERFRQEGLQSLQRERGKAEDELVADLLNIIRKYAADQKIDMLYEVSGRTLNRVPPLLVYPVEKEITNTIIELVNKGHEADLKEAKERYEAIRNRRKAAEADKPAASDEP
jgi:Skp family chaperone for outer membrane proteins